MNSGKIKRLEDFPLNEGILSSIGSAVGKIFGGRKSKLETIISKIRDAREKDLEHTIKIEKKISELHGENTPESRYNISNLNRQRRSYSSIKDQEIDALMKSADSITKDDYKLSAFYHSELAKIQSDTTDKMIKALKPYRDSSDLDKLRMEFEDLIKDTESKRSFYKDVEGTEYVSPSFSEVPKGVGKDILAFLDLPTREASSTLREFDDDKLDYYKSELESWRFSLEIEYDRAITALKKDIKKAKDSGNTWVLPSLEKEEANIRYMMKKPIDKIRSKNSIIEKEIKYRIG